MKFLKFLSHLVAGLFLACLLMGPTVLFSANGVEPIKKIGIGLCVAIVPLFLLMVWLVNYRTNSDIKSRERVYSYDKETATLTVHKRSKEVGKVISIEKLSDYSLQYHPSQMVYTGATVGGIHTGGFHKTEACYTAKTFSTKKAKLNYTNELDSLNHGQIEMIKLAPALVEDANIRFFSLLVGDCMILSHDDEATMFQRGFDAAVNSGRVDLLQDIAKGSYFAKQLTLEECKDIRNWLSGE